MLTIAALNSRLQLLGSLNGTQINRIIGLFNLLILDWIRSFRNINVQVGIFVAIKDDLSWLLTYLDNTVDATKFSALSQAPPVMNSGIIHPIFNCVIACHH